MKKFAILFAAICMVALFSQDSFAQCRGGGGYYGGGGYRAVNHGGYYRGYRPAVGISYGNFYGRPNYGGGGFYYGRPVYGGGFYRGHYGYGRGISIRF